MRIKIEIATLLIGLAGSGLATVLIFNWGALPEELTRIFAPSKFGFFVLWWTFPIGLTGLVLMCANLITGLRKLWGLRLFGFACFLTLSQSFGLYC